METGDMEKNYLKTISKAIIKVVKRYKIYDIILYGFKKNIKNMSFYVLSNENWNRKEKELSLLLNNLLSFLDKFINNEIFFKILKKDIINLVFH